MNSMHDKISQEGLTFIELMITIALVGILISFAVPVFTQMTANQRLVSSSNNLINALSTARSAAVKQKRHVTVCASTDGASCALNLTEWRNGWIVFANTSSANLQRNAAEVIESLIQVYDAPKGISNITLTAAGAGGAAILSYRPSGVIGNIAANQERLFTVCDKRGSGVARAVLVSRSGRAKSSTTGFAEAALACP